MKQLEIQFPEDSPNGVFTIRKPFSVMTAYYIPRAQIKSARKMDGIGRCGIYCLYGNGRLYIGQTRNGIERIMEHTRGKQFWSEAILFLADPIDFNLNIISGLERHAIEKAFENSPYKIDNKSVPQYESISDFEKNQIEAIYEEITFIMDFVGIRNNCGKTVVENDSYQEDTNGKEEVFNSALELISDDLINKDATIYHTKKAGTHGLMCMIDSSFVVLEGSLIDYDYPIHKSNINGALRREEALNQGIIRKDKDGKYRLMSNCVFKSPSAAAEFVLGGSRNGKVEWVDGDNIPLGSFLLHLDSNK